MKEFYFSNKYFNKKIFDDSYYNIRVEIKETPSLEISEEEYSLRITTRYEKSKSVYRNYAIEHNLPPAKHCFPHLQFKFHSEGIGQFRIRIDIKNKEEYKNAILGFIYKIKEVLGDLEKIREGITNEILVLRLVNKLEKEGEFLTKKIHEGIKKYSLEFDEKKRLRDKLRKLEEHRLLHGFIGKNNIKLIKDL